MSCCAAASRATLHIPWMRSSPPPRRRHAPSRVERIRLPWFAGSGAAKVASPGEDTPKAPRAFADPLRLPGNVRRRERRSSLR